MNIGDKVRFKRTFIKLVCNGKYPDNGWRLHCKAHKDSIGLIHAYNKPYIWIRWDKEVTPSYYTDDKIELVQ